MGSQRRSEAIERGVRMLRTALGPAIAGFLEDLQVVEVMLNPDGRIWIDRLSEGLSDTGQHLIHHVRWHRSFGQRFQNESAERVGRSISGAAIWAEGQMTGNQP